MAINVYHVQKNVRMEHVAKHLVIVPVNIHFLDTSVTGPVQLTVNIISAIKQLGNV